VLPSGVYRTAVPYRGRIYSALTNVGVCPTFSARPVHAETYILDFEGDLYGEEIDIFFLDYLREEKTFASVESLKMQINIDKNKAISENGDITWQELGLS
jgi:riboflavin kinase/FMN adenylyltransferase